MGLSKPTHLETLVIGKCKSRSLELDEALGFFNSMISMRPFPSILAFNHLLGALSKMKHYALVASMCKQMMGCSEFQPTVVSMTIWLRCLCNLKEVKLGFSVFCMIIKLGLQPDPYTMNALLLGLTGEGKIKEAMGLFWKLLTNGYPYDQCTYGQCEEATSLLSKMATERIVPDIGTFNILLDAVSKQGTNDKGLEVLMVMDQNGVKPNGLTYRTMIRMYCALGEMNMAKDVFDSMETHGFAPDLAAYKMLINGYAKSKRKVDTVRLAEEMLQKGLTLDLETHTLLRGAIKEPEMIKAGSGCLYPGLLYNIVRDEKRKMIASAFGDDQVPALSIDKISNADIIWWIFFSISGGSIDCTVKECLLQIFLSSPFSRREAGKFEALSLSDACLAFFFTQSQGLQLGQLSNCFGIKSKSERLFLSLRPSGFGSPNGLYYDDGIEKTLDFEFH
ncbi:hypothetical protein V6N13_101222 [Hibiscus sabdariffa]